ncbi:MAG: dTDP-4-dehydrorhamnose reductase [Candidatus Omnitrophota bacterium]
MKVLITGSSGMLGSALCEVLGEKHELIGIDIRYCKEIAAGPSLDFARDRSDPSPFAKASEDKRNDNTSRHCEEQSSFRHCEEQSSFRHCEERSDEAISKFYKVDLANKSAVKDIFDKEKPELVIHTAAWTDVDGCETNPEKAERLNVSITRDLAEIAERSAVKLIYISTDFVFDGEKKTPYTEDDGTAPIGVYGKTKLRGEETVQDMLSRYVILRTSWLYGEGGKNFVDTILNSAVDKKELKVVDDQVGSPTYTKDLAYAIEKLIEVFDKINRNILHVSNSGQCSWFEFAKEILKDNNKTEIKPVTSKELNRPAPRPKFSVLDNTKFEKITEHKMRPWKEALGEYLRMVKQFKSLKVKKFKG